MKKIRFSLQINMTLQTWVGMLFVLKRYLLFSSIFCILSIHSIHCVRNYYNYSQFKSKSIGTQENSFSDLYQTDLNYPLLVTPSSINEKTEAQNIFSSKGNKNILLSREKDSKGRILITRVSADILEREGGVSQDRIRLAGNAVMYHNQIRITAQKMIIENGERGELSNHIQVFDKKNNLSLFATRATYVRSEQKITLEGEPYIIRKSKDNKNNIFLVCSRIVHYLDIQKSIIEGEINVVGNTWNIFADEGVYEGDNNALRLERNAIFLSDEDYLTGELMFYHQDKKMIELQKKVTFYTYKNSFRSKNQNTIKQEKKSKLETKKKQELYILTAENVFYIPKEKLIAKDDVIFTRKGSILKTQNLELLGENLSDLRADKEVFLRDDEQAVVVQAGHLDYSHKKQKIVLRDKAKINFTEKKIELHAGFIERDLIQKYVRAYNHVSMEQKGQTEYSKLNSEYAYYDERKEIITMDGSPKIIKKNTLLGAQKIWVYPKEKRILFKNYIRGSM